MQIYLFQQPVHRLLQNPGPQPHQAPQSGQIAAYADTRWVESSLREIADVGRDEAAAVDLATVREDKAHNQPQEGGLASAIRAQQAKHSTSRHFQRQPVKGQRRTIALGELFGADHGW